jgi:VanZ family protein
MRIAALAGGWLLAVAIAWLSLAPPPPEPSVEIPDKLAHFVAYAVLMFWFCFLYRSGKTRAAYGVLWIGMGIALEFAQGATAYRSYELADMAANALGVLVGALAALSLPRAAAAGGKETP